MRRIGSTHAKRRKSPGKCAVLLLAGALAGGEMISRGRRFRHLSCRCTLPSVALACRARPARSAEAPPTRNDTLEGARSP
ncbi:hypothetical protein, partial [Streptomyces sp. NPDC056821]|uniref:hypothetical protein n=1 Tax=Streptomyces sp. NPDC056821 TaxID=3345952 RepID=UPI0036C3C3DF